MLAAPTGFVLVNSFYKFDYRITNHRSVEEIQPDVDAGPFAWPVATSLGSMHGAQREKIVHLM